MSICVKPWVQPLLSAAARLPAPDGYRGTLQAEHTGFAATPRSLGLSESDIADVAQYLKSL